MTKLIASQSTIWIVLALALFLIPEVLGGLVLTSVPASTVAVERLFGAELTGLAISSYLTRGSADLSMRRGLAAAYMTCNTMGTIASASGVLMGGFRPIAWLFVAVYASYAIAFAGYLASPMRRQ